jgi:hypothetical protein
VRKRTSKDEDLNTEEQNEDLTLRRLDTAPVSGRNNAYAVAEEVAPKYWIIVTRIYQDAKQNLVGNLDYDVGKDEGDPRVNFRRTFANLLGSVSFTILQAVISCQ